jgi:acetylornithine/succinyldiaminopimelate/putrescine aminotransferase/predicted amino acid dehydrogenase
MEGALNPTLQRLLALCRMDRTWVRGEGVWLTDAHGRRFLDCYAQYGAVALGHNAPAVVAAVRAALDECEPAMVQPYRAPHAVALATALARLAPGNLSRCFFTTSGAEAVEAAIKLVRARTGRPIILSAHGSFHGKTLGALAATGQTHHAEDFGPMPPGFERIPFGDAEALARRLDRDAPRIAAVLLEPIQGERGVFLPPAGYLARVRELCTRHGVALVLDEIQTGLGRTGRLFACEHDEVAPDLLLVAKALGGGLFPLGACLSSAAFWDERFALRHSSTFANNNVACRVGRAVLETLTQGGLCDEAARKGERLRPRLTRLAERYPRVIAAVRGRGLLNAIEFHPQQGDGGLFLSFLSHQGLYAYAIAATIAEQASVLVLPTLGETPVIRLAPPLIITDTELDLALDGIESVCDQLDKNPMETITRALGAFDQKPCTTNGRAMPLVLPGPVVRFDRRRAPSGNGARSREPSGTYAFLTHPTRPEDVPASNPGMEYLTPAELNRFCDFIAALPPVVVLRAPTVRSVTGAVAEGFIITLPLLPAEMARRGVHGMTAEIARAVDLACKCGARIVGLGGHTTPFSRRGRAVQGRGAAITTGNALTAGMAFAAIGRAAEQVGVALEGACVGIVGARGSVGSLCARLFARVRPRKLMLVGNPATGGTPLGRMREELEWRPGAVHITTGLDRLAECAIVVTATGAGRPVLDDAPLTPGTIVCDVARPPDASRRLRERTDLVVLDGGLVALPDPRTRFGAGNLLGLPDGVQLACLSETVLLALEGDQRDHGVGDEIPLAEVDDMMTLAARHGFRLAEPRIHRLDRSDRINAVTTNGAIQFTNGKAMTKQAGSDKVS